MVEYIRVDSAHHTALAVLGLRAVEPHGLGVHDTDCVGKNLGGRADRSVRGHEAREESGGHVGHHVLDGLAWLVESGLDNRVVLSALLEHAHITMALPSYLGVELELNQVAYSRLDVLRREGERSVGASNLDYMSRDVSCRCCACCSSAAGSCCRACGCKCLRGCDGCGCRCRRSRQSTSRSLSHVRGRSAEPEKGRYDESLGEIHCRCVGVGCQRVTLITRVRPSWNECCKGD